MYDPGRSEGSVASTQEFLLATDANRTAALQHQVEFFLALVRVKGVFLTRLEGVQSGKERLPLHQRSLGHLLGIEPGEVGKAFHKHGVQFTPPQSSILRSCRYFVGDRGARNEQLTEQSAPLKPAAGNPCTYRCIPYQVPGISCESRSAGNLERRQAPAGPLWASIDRVGAARIHPSPARTAIPDTARARRGQGTRRLRAGFALRFQPRSRSSSSFTVIPQSQNAESEMLIPDFVKTGKNAIESKRGLHGRPCLEDNTRSKRIFYSIFLNCTSRHGWFGTVTSIQTPDFNSPSARSFMHRCAGNA
jgi:hypothetical protein